MCIVLAFLWRMPIYWFLIAVRAQICDVLHEQSLSGNPLVASCFSRYCPKCGCCARSCLIETLIPCFRLLFHCNQVLYNQTLSWLLHGSLVDPHKVGPIYIVISLVVKKSNRKLCWRELCFFRILLRTIIYNNIGEYLPECIFQSS